MENVETKNYNPFAAVFKKAFEDDVAADALHIPSADISYPPRVHHFMYHLNRFLLHNGEKAFYYKSYVLNEHKLFEYALFLRGYMRDAQTVLAHLKQEHAASKDLIMLFQASSEYVVACNHQLHDKRIFDNNVGYHTWKINLSHGLQNATYQPKSSANDPTQRSLYLFMPFRIEPQEQTLSKWIYMNMRQTLDNPLIFDHQVKTYAVHYPLQKSRSSNISSLLQTLNQPSSYFEPQDLAFVKQNWLSYVAQQIEIDQKGNVLWSKPHTSQQLNNHFRHITIFSYCAGTANAHRCLTALQHITTQIYGKKQTREAMANVFLCSYGFLPIRSELPYSGVHFYSHRINDKQKIEPFVNLNNHALYEQTKCKSPQSSAQLSIMPDGRNFVAALSLPENFSVVQNNQVVPFIDGEFGHSMTNVNTPNILDTDNFAHHLFKSVLQNSSLGLRGKDVLNISTTRTPNHQIVSAVMWANRQNLR